MTNKEKIIHATLLANLKPGADISVLGGNVEYCEKLYGNIKSYERSRNLWEALLLIVGAMIVVSIGYALWAYQSFENIKALTALLGIIVEGAAVGFLVARRKNAKDEEDAIWKIYREDCKQ